MTRFKLHHALLATALAVVPFGIGTAQAAGTLTVALAADDGSWDPIDTFTLNWRRIGSNIFDALILRDTNLNLLPGLATKWEMMDDNKRIRFTLR